MIDPKDPQFEEAAKQAFEDRSQLGAHALDLASAGGFMLDAAVTTLAEVARGVGAAALAVLSLVAALAGAITGS